MSATTAARQLGEEIRAELAAQLGRPVALFDNDPEADDHDPRFGAHIQVVTETRCIVVQIPNRDDHLFWGEWAGDDAYHEQPIAGRDGVIPFVADAAGS